MAAEGDAPVAFPSQYDESGMTEFDRVEAELRGEALRLLCKLPDESVHDICCNMGHDVSYAKSQLARKLGKTWEDVAKWRFFLDDKFMIDPLSLNDFPEITGSQSKEVRIRVEIPDE
eukprot:TRINITY_DN32578_c0_g1_i1.p2 TRINITY_DN32578_c0_g1~~TRINITY_DN32578_c0_g1_i1.p2  ORF type:complete len:117 (+),score=30.88 TRINITY_DN32578_c0_g1_i1:103-453(+)